MTGTSWVVHLIYDITMITFGSYGAFVLVSEYVEMEKPFSLSKIIAALRKRWYAALALSLAVALFLYHIATELKV